MIKLAFLRDNELEPYKQERGSKHYKKDCVSVEGKGSAAIGSIISFSGLPQMLCHGSTLLHQLSTIAGHMPSHKSQTTAGRFA